jgi:phosphoglucosamine mutase
MTESSEMGSFDKVFGTDGIRGAAGEFPLDCGTVGLIGRSLVRNLTQETGRSAAIVIGRDTRESGPWIEACLAEGARTEGATVESAGVITTPGIAYLAKSKPFDAGVVISASHNPYWDNGIKVFSPTGKKLDDAMEQRIEADLRRYLSDGAEIETVLSAVQAEPLKEDPAFREEYISYLSKVVAVGLDLDGVQVAIDCANGAASAIAPRVFEELGATVTVLSAEPDGKNINEACGCLHPTGLQQTIAGGRFDLGIAFDGDADRALFVDETGSVVDGDQALLILAGYLKSEGKLPGSTVVSTVMSNMGLELALSGMGIELVRASVGDRYVLEELLARGAGLGGEQSGHIIFPHISLAGDGIITAIELLRALRGRKLSTFAAALKKLPQVLVNVKVRSKPPLQSLNEVQSQMKSIEAELQGRGRLLVRYSGTENLARVMIEGENQHKIQQMADGLAALIQETIL